MKKVITTLFIAIVSLNIGMAQPPDIRYISMAEILPYVLPFYAITLIALGLFIHKLMRPNFSSKWLYITTIVGIVGAGVLAYQFKSFKETKLTDPSTQNKTMSVSDQRIQKESENEVMGNFWKIAIPNFIILGLGMALDYRNKKSATTPEE